MLKIRIIHRYLGFFLAGIMAIYALSGITLIFRKTNTFKIEVAHEVQLTPELASEEVGRALGIRDFKVLTETADLLTFENGTFDKSSGLAQYTSMELPSWLDKVTHLHKATTSDPLYYFNIFFGVALLFFASSSFLMFLPKTPIFKKGLWFALGGFILAAIMLFV